MKNWLITFMIVSICSIGIVAQDVPKADEYADYYGVYFKAFPWTIQKDPVWVTSVKNNWGATGVQVDAVWKRIEPRRSSLNAAPIYDWREFDTAIDRVLRAGLDLNITVRMGTLLPDWVDFNSNGEAAADGVVHNGLFDKEDFHIGHNGEHVWQGEAPLRDKNSNRYFNLSSDRSVEAMLRFYKDVMEHVQRKYVASGRYKTNRRAIEFVPTINFVSEMELNSNWRMTGYSAKEQEEFRLYLRQKYGGKIGRLNSSWGSDYDEFDEINLLDPQLNWQKPDLSHEQYVFANGREEWLHYKFGKLSDMVNRFAEATKEMEFHMGVQLGSLHDYRLDFRGFYDPTAFLEIADAFRLADIKGYEKVFDFSANYARSMAEYWQWRDGKKRGFSSESNWHLFGYRKGSKREYARDLAQVWIQQVNAYYQQGADCHIIYGWGNTDNKSNEHAKSSSVQRDYRAFIRTLKSLARKPIRKVNTQQAIHLSARSFTFKPGLKEKFYYHKIMQSQESNRISAFKYEDTNSTIITDFMITYSPDYLNRFSNFSVSKSSEYMPKAVKEKLLETNRIQTSFKTVE